MKILVCMKQVPQKDAPLKLNESGTWIRDDVSYEVNEPDAFALEEALRQKEKHTGEVVVITAGPARSQQVLREGLAKGAYRAIHLEDNGFVGLDAFNMAKAFVAAIKDENSGPAMAEECPGVPASSGTMDLSLGDRGGRSGSQRLDPH